MIGRRISQCTRFKQSGKTDDRLVSTIHEQSFHIGRFFLKGIPSDIAKVTVEYTPYVDDSLQT